MELNKIMTIFVVTTTSPRDMQSNGLLCRKKQSGKSRSLEIRDNHHLKSDSESPHHGNPLRGVRRNPDPARVVRASRGANNGTLRYLTTVINDGCVEHSSFELAKRLGGCVLFNRVYSGFSLFVLEHPCSVSTTAKPRS